MARALTDIRSLARSHTDMALRTLAGIAEQGDAPPAARVAAATALLDRGWGKPTQPIAGDEDNPLVIQQIIRKIVEPSNSGNSDGGQVPPAA